MTREMYSFSRHSKKFGAHTSRDLEDSWDTKKCTTLIIFELAWAVMVPQYTGVVQGCEYSEFMNVLLTHVAKTGSINGQLMGH